MLPLAYLLTHCNHPPGGLQGVIRDLVTLELETSQVIVWDISYSHGYSYNKVIRQVTDKW